MNIRPWVYFFHLPVPAISSLEPREVSVAYDSSTDTLFGGLWQLKGPTINCVVGRFEYLRIELDSRRPIGTMIEEFTRGAVAKNARYLELAAICSELLKPSSAAKEMLSLELMLKVVHREVVLATRTYDRLHGIRSSRSRRIDWIERELRPSANDVAYELRPAPQESTIGPQPQEDWVVAEFRRALDLIGHRPLSERETDFDRILQYWYGQPNGSIKRATGHLLLDFTRRNPLNHHSVRGLGDFPEEILLRALKAS